MQNPATTLRDAANYLEQLAGPNPASWEIERGDTGIYIQVSSGGSFKAPGYYAARLLTLHDPQVLFLLADVLHGLADAAEDGTEPEPGWLAYAEAVLLKKGVNTDVP